MFLRLLIISQHGSSPNQNFIFSYRNQDVPLTIETFDGGYTKSTCNVQGKLLQGKKHLDLDKKNLNV